MPSSNQSWTDERVERIIGSLLRDGVLLAAGVVLVGGIVYLVRYGGGQPNYHVFRGEPADLHSVSGILRGILTLHSHSIIQFGLLLLIATPIARVVFSVFAFALQRDRTYVIITLIVLTVLLYSLLSGPGG
ncbi:MAG: DUF1634 domain-containing protein [Acidobacteriia bacterium]|nr:DUF1634 domain-containing protein [Terriglobia bacterium]